MKDPGVFVFLVMFFCGLGTLVVVVMFVGWMVASLNRLSAIRDSLKRIEKHLAGK